MGSILALAGKDLRQMARDRAGLLVTIGLPILIAVLFGYVFSTDGQPSALPVAVVVEDDGPGATAFVEALRRASEVEVSLSSRADAVDRVRRGEAIAYVVVPEGFGRAEQGMFLGQTPTLEVGYDPAHQAEGALLEGLLMRQAVDRLEQLMDQPDRLRPQVQLALASLAANPLASSSDPTARFLAELDRYLASLGDARASVTPVAPWVGERGAGGAWRPLAIDAAAVETASAGPRNAFEISFPQAVVWALIACVATFAASIVRERSQGTLVRLFTAPLSPAHIIGGKALSCFAASVVLATALITLGVLFFGLHPTSPVLLMLALMSAAAALVGLMMLLSVVGKTERSTSGSAWAILMIMAMFGGGMMPLTFMPDWMVQLSHLSPIKWAILALEGGLWRGFDLAELALPCAILLAIGVSAFALGARSLHAKLA